MTPSEATNQATRDEWRELGFFYDKDDDKKIWRLIGSKQGLLKFCDILDEYTSDPLNQTKSEHEHYGPYMYLTIMTWDNPGIDGYSIFGTLDDLKRLSIIIKKKLFASKQDNKIVINTQYSDDVEYTLVLEVRKNDFDPSSVDPCL